MKVPLKIELLNDKADIIYNGESHIQELPVLPAFYLLENPTNKVCIVEEFNKKILRKDETKLVYKCSFNSLNEYYFAKKIYQNEIIYTEEYLNQLYLDNPDFKIDCKEPSVLFFDIECETNGSQRFPEAKEIPILLITTKFGNETIIFDTYDLDEEQMLLNFLKYLSKVNPDILCGYNIFRFDLPYILERCKIHEINVEKFLNRNSNKEIELERISFYGRIIYDLYQQCSADNKLRKLKNFKLDTIAKHFKFGQKVEIDFIKDLKSTKTNQERKEIFLHYAKTDVELCEKIFDLYYLTKYHLAHMLNVSLNDAVNAYPSFIPNLFHSRPLFAAGYLPQGSNIENYPIFQKQEKLNKKLYQGAIAKIYKTGLFEKVTHIDYSSMYPNLMITFNISTENVTLVEIKPYEHKFVFSKTDEYILAEFPDELLNRNLVIKISLHDGIVVKNLKDCYAQRLMYKKKANESGSTADRSIENIFKLQLNSSYGYNGAKFAKWGTLLGAAFITAMGRWLITETIELVKDKVIELDTDGIYLDEDVDIAQINLEITKKVLALGVKENYLFLDKTKYDQGFFSKAKNYILQKGTTYAYTGNSFVSRRFCKLAKDFQDEIVDAIFTKKKTGLIISKYYSNLNKRPISDFSMGMRIKQDLSGYKSARALAKVLAEQLYKAFGNTDFDQVAYVVTKTDHRYMPIDLANPQKIDFDYYKKELDKILERFNINKNQTLALWQ